MSIVTIPRYRAIIETNAGNWGQTNMIYSYLFESEIVLQKEGVFAVSYYTIKFNSDNIILLRYKKISKFRIKIIIYHTEQGIKAPYEVLITSRIRDNELEMLDRLCESIRKDRINNG
jgi:hypothetical protein